MTNYTPTTEEMRAFYTAERLDGPHLEGFPPPTVDQAEAEFNAWLAAHDAEVLAAERERIIEDMQDCSHPDDWGVPCVYVEGYAKRMRGEAGHEGDS